MTSLTNAPRHSDRSVAPARPNRILSLSAHLSRAIFVLGALLGSLVTFLSRNWSDLSPDEILFHLRASFDGTDTSVINRYFFRYLPLVACGCIAVFIVMHLCRKKSLKLWAASTIATALMGVTLVGGAFYFFSDMVGLDAFLPSDGSDFIGDNYVQPTKGMVKFPDKKRNLIFIFLESMETTYADEANGGGWSENLIPELTELAQEGECFAGDSGKINGGLVMPGCTFTTGAMFCQSSGVPLKLPFASTEMSSLESFFPSLTLLGDVLQEQGYRQRLLIGSNADFGNRREFYTIHGNFEIWDYTQAIESGFIPEDYKVFWGFEDEKLFERAKESCLELAGGEEPFNLTMLTVDTHFEDGYICRLCRDEHPGNQYANVMSCSSRQVAEFVRWIQDQDFYDNTTIILSGDHTTMDKDFCDEVSKDYPRKTFTAIINGAAKPQLSTSREYTTCDMFPTTLAAIGCEIKGDRLGIGTNLYASTPTFTEELGPDEILEKLSHQSRFLNSFSGANIDEEFIDRIARKTAIYYNNDAESGEHTGFVLKNIWKLSIEMVESAHMTVTDTRTGASQDYPMTPWSTNLNHTVKYQLLAKVDIPEDELRYYKADAYITVTGMEERLFCSWNGAEQEDAS